MPIVYGINNGAVSIQSHPILDQYTQTYVIHFLSEKTGGVVLSTFNGNYAEQLDKILQELEGRYDLGIEVADPDSKPHEITVKLSDAARKNLKSVDVRFAKVFVPSAQTTASADQSLQASLLAAIRAATPSTEIAFDASCRKSQGPDCPVPLIYRPAQSDVEPARKWRSPDRTGPRERGTFAAGQRAHERAQEIQGGAEQGRSRSKPEGDYPVCVSLPIPGDAARLQFALRDTGTSRVGTFGVGVDQIRVAASAPAH